MDKQFLAPAEIVDAAIKAGKTKAERKFIPMLILAILAGAFIAFGAEASNMAAFNLLKNPETFGLGRTLAGTIFPVGLMLVVLSGAELFTGNTLISITVYEKKTSIGLMLKNWAVVYVGNFIGSILIVLMVAKTGLLNSGGMDLGMMTVKIALGKVNLSFWGALLSGIMCNWLVCLGVWLAFAANSVQGKILGIFFPIWLFVTSGFEHSVANMYYIPAGILAKAQYGELLGVAQSELDALNWGNFITANLIPVTIGNIIGGILFVAAAYWFALHKKPAK